MGWLRAASFDDLKEGGVIGVDVAGTAVALYLLDGVVYATHNICTHQFAFLSEGYVEDGCIECPLHQGQFDIRTGKAQCAPVTGRLATYRVKREGDDIFVDLEAPAVEVEAPKAPLAQDHRSFVIIGGGQAGCRAAQHLRGEGFAGRIVMLAEEGHRPYERPPLSKEVLLGKAGADDCAVLKPAEFDALEIDLRTGSRATAIDRKAKSVTLSTGETLPYDRLLIATGARARTLPDGSGDGVLYLRTLEDAQAIGAALSRARSLALIGGGFIGLEIASVAREKGLAVTVIEREPALMSRILPPALGQAFQTLAESKGVAFRLDTKIEAIRRNGAGTTLAFADGGELAVDLVVAGIGAIANAELAEQAGLSVKSGGIVIDTACRTSDADIFAAGDCALYPEAVGGTRLRLESWANAEAQGRAAALAMLGKPAEKPPLPWFWTEQFGLNIQMAGIPQAGDGVAVQGGIGQPESVYLTERDGAIASAIIFGDAETFRIARRRLETGADVAEGLRGLRWLDQQEEESSMGYERALESLPAQATPQAKQFVWPAEGLNRVPDWVYTDDHIYGLEVEKIFKGRTWNYVGLEAEIPNPGDFTRSFVGPVPVVVSRDEEGGINVFENRCSHRAAEFCRELRGNVQEFVCPYHQWSYDLKGNLAGVPFRRGVDGKGGMPADFDPADHHPRKLSVTTRGGVIFASYAEDMEPFDSYLGPEMTREFDATFDGRKLVVLGYYRNTLPGNWKLYHENLKDPYHATLLHTFLVTFGLLVAGNKSQMLCDASGRHGAMCSAKSDGKNVSADAKKEMRAYKEGMQLEEPRFMDFVPEFDSPWSVTMSTIWPNLIVQREMNTLGVRHIVPEGPNQFTMIWTMFGFEGDDEEMTRHRLRQGNLMGPAGFLGLEDNEAMKFVQDGMKHVPGGEHLVALDPGTATGTADTLISESAIRAMYKHWRDVIGV
ncbi:FAD-dependent oxidoreductase [Oceanibaculum sp.]|uniref:FAD-dependent oxidoreductase n=1 Tax=Oceanibaculum sp. TaxID=1903597 RepID=UPI002588F534|nr:FAD-dependent oxidoreductase [Oceanibaculum sp.]MCH2394267.1 FAD-dependent oxidoreductase [Oceanibaculum sp.]